MKCQICTEEMTRPIGDWYCPKGCDPKKVDPQTWMRVGAKLALTENGLAMLSLYAEHVFLACDTELKAGQLLTVQTVGKTLFDGTLDGVEMSDGREVLFTSARDRVSELFILHTLPPETEEETQRGDDEPVIGKSYILQLAPRILRNGHVAHGDTDQFDHSRVDVGDEFIILERVTRGSTGDMYRFRHVYSSNVFRIWFKHRSEKAPFKEAFKPV